MTKASSLITHLNESLKNVDQQTVKILTDYVCSLGVKDVGVSRTNYRNSIHDLRNRTNLDKQESFYKDRCYAYLTNIIKKQSDLMYNIEATLSNFNDLLSKTKLAMDVNYKLSQVELLQNKNTGKIKLTNTVPSNYLTNKLNALHLTLQELKDIKALAAESVEDSENCKIFSTVVDFFKSEDIFHDKLGSLTLMDTFSVEDRIEIIRPVLSTTTAKDAGYTSDNCNRIFRQFGKLLEDVNELNASWFSSFSRVNSNAISRYEKVCKEALSLNNENDQQDKYTSADIRISRINKAVNLLLAVICPSILQEMKGFTETLMELGVHKHLDDRAEDQPKIEAYSTGYESMNGIKEDVTFMKFSQNKNPLRHTQYVPKSLSYCIRRQAGLNEYLTKVLSLFNKTDEKEIPCQTQSKIYSAEQLQHYVDSWAERYEAYNNWITELITDDTPLVNWDMFKPDLDTFQLIQEMGHENLRYNLDLEVISQPSDVNVPYLYKSSLRDGTDSYLMMGTESLGFKDQDTQHELRLSLQRLFDVSYDFSKNLTTLNNILRKFAEPVNKIDQENLIPIYNLINDVLQWNNWCQHDLYSIEKIFSA